MVWSCLSKNGGRKKNLGVNATAPLQLTRGRKWVGDEGEILPFLPLKRRGVVFRGYVEDEQGAKI